MSSSEDKSDGKVTTAFSCRETLAVSEQEVTAEPTDSSAASLFRPSKLTTTVDKIWKTTAPTSDSEKIPEVASVIDLTMGRKDAEDKETALRTEESDDRAQSSRAFIFGQQIKDRVKMGKNCEKLESTCESGELPGFRDLVAETANGTDTQRGPTDWTQVTAKSDTSKRPEDNDYTVITGEEDEKNLVQITCKLYVFDRKSSTWSEKGYSTLRINEKMDGEEKTTRIVIRLQGVPRLIINSRLFPQMIIRPIGSKKLQFPATNAEPPHEMLTCLIMGKPSDIEEVFHVLQNALDYLKNLNTPAGEEENQGEENRAKRTITETGNRKKKKE
uniref:RanBD1 domain-containing protein n=1 Tax=Trichuris muris TaxID=70415 RepID=A0A5S6PZ00_TRIMR